MLTKQVLLLSKHRGLLTREGVHQHITALQQRGLRLGEDVGGGHGPGVVGGHAAAELGVKGLEVARVEEVEGAGLLGGGGLRLEPVSGRRGLRLLGLLGLLGGQGLELLVVKSNERLDSLWLGGGGLLRLLGEHSLLGHRLAGRDSLGDWGGPQGSLGPLDGGGLLYSIEGHKEEQYIFSSREMFTFLSSLMLCSKRNCVFSLLKYLG